MKCPQCGASLPDGLQICFQCGARLSLSMSDFSPGQAGKNPVKSKKGLITIVTVAVIAAAGIAVWQTGLYRNIPFLSQLFKTSLPADIETENPDSANMPPSSSDVADGSRTTDRNNAGSVVEGLGSVMFDNDSAEHNIAGGADEVLGIIGFSLVFEDVPESGVLFGDFSDFLLTKDGGEIPVSFLETVKEQEDSAGRAVLSVEFKEPLSESGVYVLAFNLFGVPVTVDYDNVVEAAPAPPQASEPIEANWADVYADFAESEFTEWREYLHFSDRGTFPVHSLGSGETGFSAVMQASLYEIPGFDYPVMALMEFLPQTNNPDALDTFQMEVVYLIKDGAVTWELTGEESAAIYYENEESGMTFVNGEPIARFELVSWENVEEARWNLQALCDWLRERAEMTAAEGGAGGASGSETHDVNLLELVDSYTMQDLIDDGTISEGDPDLVTGNLMFYRVRSSAVSDTYVVFQHQDPPRPGELRVEAVRMSLFDLMGVEQASYIELVDIFGSDLAVGYEPSEDRNRTTVASVIYESMLFRFRGDGMFYYDVFIERP